MNSFRFLFAFAIALIASGPVCGYGPASGYGPATGYGPASGYGPAAGYGPASGPSEVSADGSSAGAAASAAEGASVSGVGPSVYGNNQNLPYAPGNTRGNSVTSSITYPQNKGEILIHRPAAIIVKRPPTRVVVNHPPLVVKPAPVVLHKPPAVVLRKVYVKQYPRPVKVEPVYVNVVKPPAEKYFVNEKQQQLSGSLSPVPNSLGPVGPVPSGNLVSAGSGNPNAGIDGAAANAGYQLLSSSDGLAALANLGQPGQGYGPAPKPQPSY